jgi:glycosyltransferase involved in cell wall biosynthesis
MRIAVLLQTPRDEHSAVYLAYATLAEEFARRGAQLEIVTPSDLLPSIAAGRFTPLIYPLLVKRWVEVHARDRDLFVFHSYAGWRAAAVCASAAVPFVVAFHGLEPLYHQALRGLVQRNGGLSWRYRLLQEQLMPHFLQRACEDAALVTCLNRQERGEIERRGWAAADRVRVTRHGVGDEFFTTTARSTAPLHLLFVGQWLEMKGIGALSDAAGRLLARHPELRLTCAGTLTPASQVFARFPAGVRDRVDVKPRVSQSELVGLYGRSHIFVFPSLYEGFGRALLEAMAAGLPIVCTNVGVAADALRDGDSCMTVPPSNADAIVDAVERLVADSQLRTSLGQRARAVAEAYRAEDAVREVANLLSSLIRSRDSAVSYRP